jgi:hypothetical protein
MLKKSIVYTDFNGVKRTEDFYFNLSKAEVTEMELSTDGGVTAYIEKIVEADNRPRLIELFKEFILKAYGEKTPDGKGFVKTQEVRERFQYSAAYSVLFMELTSNAELAAAFFNGVLPEVE